MAKNDELPDATGELAGAHEVGEILGVSRQRVSQLARQQDFPKPIDHLKVGRIWRRREIERYAAKRAKRLEAD